MTSGVFGAWRVRRSRPTWQLSARQHEIHTVATPSPNTIGVDATVTYWFLSGEQTSLPAVTTFRIRDAQVANIHLDMDIAALRRATWNTTSHAYAAAQQIEREGGWRNAANIDHLNEHGDLVFAVLVFPFACRGDRLDDVPVLGDLGVLDPEQVIEGGGFAVELAFADDEDEVALAEHAMNAVVFRHDASFGPGFERCARFDTPSAIWGWCWM